MNKITENKKDKFTPKDLDIAPELVRAKASARIAMDALNGKDTGTLPEGVSLGNWVTYCMLSSLEDISLHLLLNARNAQDEQIKALTQQNQNLLAIIHEAKVKFHEDGTDGEIASEMLVILDKSNESNKTTT